MPQDANHLVWIDMEMTGLDPDRDRIIEIAIVVTDSPARRRSPRRRCSSSTSPTRCSTAMDDWNTSHPRKSGLVDRVRASTLEEAAVEEQMLAFLARHVPARTSPMCGNSICQDRRFLARWMPRLEAYFHYRNLDVCTLKELARRWRPELAAAW